MTTRPIPSPCACTTIRRASRVLARAYDSALAPAELNVTQFAVLRAIDRHAGEALTSVAEDLCMDRTSLYRALAPLSRSGWIELVPGADRRARAACLTARGRRVSRRAAVHWARAQAAIVGEFGSERWKRLARELEVLSRCARALDVTKPRSNR